MSMKSQLEFTNKCQLVMKGELLCVNIKKVITKELPRKKLIEIANHFGLEITSRGQTGMFAYSPKFPLSNCHDARMED